VNAEDFAKAAIRAGGTPPERELRIEVFIYERKRPAGLPGEKTPAWSNFRLRNKLVLGEAAIKWERVSGNNGEAITVHAGGTHEDTLEEVDPQGRPS